MDSRPGAPFAFPLLAVCSSLSLLLLWSNCALFALPRVGYVAYLEATLLAVLVFSAAACLAARPVFSRRVVGDATPESLGAIRVVTCGVLLVSIIWEDVASTALLPVELRQPMGLLGLLHALPVGAELLTRSEPALRGFDHLTALLLVLGLLGWHTRLVIPLSAVCYLVAAGLLRQYASFYHTGLVPLYVLIVLAFTPCGDGLSVDRLRKLRRGDTVPPADQPSAVYGWSRYACWVVVAVPYVMAGLSKLRRGGPLWWDATNMRAILFRDSLDPMEFDWGVSLRLADAPDLVFALLGISGVLGELTFGLVLVSRLARRILPFAMAGMHVGILFLQNVLFFDLILLQLVFVDYTAARQALAKRLVSRHGRVQADESAGRARGRVRHRAAGFWALAGAVPTLRLAAPWPCAPWLARLGVGPYRRAAGARSDADAHDGERVTEPPGVRADAVPRSGLRGLAYPLGVSALVAVLALCWVYRIEFYPLTGMQMYSWRDDSGRVTYHKVLAHLESGLITRAPLERAIGALADARYRPLLRHKCFTPVHRPVCERFLMQVGAVHNRRAGPGERVIAYEVQRWVWDFRVAPRDPHYGTLTDRLIVRPGDVCNCVAQPSPR